MNFLSRFGLKVLLGRNSLFMRILITGGFGFIGGKLGQYLQQVGHQVILASRKASHPPSWLPNAEVEQIDWNDGRTLQNICTEVDVLIQAAGVNAHDCVADPETALEFNGLATARLVAAASRAGVRRFVYLSTAHVYRNPLVGIISEDTCPRNLHPYATSHLAGENAVLSAGLRGQIEGVVLRLSNAYGSPVHKNVNCWMLLVNDLCRQAIETRKMVLRSSGLQQRDFIAMKEVCRATDHLVRLDLGSGSPMQINVGSGASLSVLDMARLIQQRCKHVLNFEPELLRLESETVEKNELLEYRIDVLSGTGFKLLVNHSNEIDELLRFCDKQFPVKSEARI